MTIFLNFLALLFLIALFIGWVLLTGLPIFLIYHSKITKVRAQRFPDPKIYNNSFRTRSERIKDFSVWFGNGFVLVLIFLSLIHFGCGVGVFKGRSYKRFSKVSKYGICERYTPEHVEDFRYKCENFLRGGTSMVGFTLDEQEYEEFLSSISEIEKGEVYRNLDKPLDFTGLKVSETTNFYDIDGDYIGFPTESIKYVLDDDINDYTILFYDTYTASDSGIEAIVTNPNTRRVIIYDYGCD